MNESARALCQIIERRPFLTLTDQELGSLTTAMAAELARCNIPVNQDLYGRLADEVSRRRDFARGQRDAYDQADFALRNTRPETDPPLTTRGRTVADSLRRYGFGGNPEGENRS